MPSTFSRGVPVASAAAALAVAFLWHRRRRCRLLDIPNDTDDDANGDQQQQLHRWPEQSYRHCTLSSEEIKRTLPTKPKPDVSDMEMHSDDIDLDLARHIFDTYGCLIVRGLNDRYVDDIRNDAESLFSEAVDMLEDGQCEAVMNNVDGTSQHLGWTTPNGTLFIPAPPGHVRDKQVMVLGLDIHNSSSMLRAAIDPKALDIVGALLGSENIELFGKGQCFYKEGIKSASAADAGGACACACAGAGGLSREMYPGSRLDEDVAAPSDVGPPGGNPKYLHQDSAYFMFAKRGAVATLNYSTRTDRVLDNGPLHVVPGSHRHGHVRHVDTPSHLGVPAGDWSFAEDALCVDGDAGDAIFFHIHLLHGSTPNRSARSRATFIHRYITPDDYQAFYATDVRMRKKARREYERLVRRGGRPTKEHNLLVRGRRVWDPEGAECANMDAGVHH